MKGYAICATARSGVDLEIQRDRLTEEWRARYLVENAGLDRVDDL